MRSIIDLKQKKSEKEREKSLQKACEYVAMRHEQERFIKENRERYLENLKSDHVATTKSSNHPHETFSKFDPEKTMQKIWRLRKK